MNSERLLKYNSRKHIKQIIMRNEKIEVDREIDILNHINILY